LHPSKVHLFELPAILKVTQDALVLTPKVTLTRKWV
jgi:hypothetical protein